MSDEPSPLSASTDPWNELAAGLFFALWSAVGWCSALTTPALWRDDHGLDPGPGLLPGLVLWSLTLGGAALIAVGGVKLCLRRVPMPKLAGLARRAALPMALAASMVVYVVAIFRLGFVPSSLVFAAGWMAVLGAREGAGGAPWLTSIAGAGLGVGLIYLLFVRAIGVPLP